MDNPSKGSQRKTTTEMSTLPSQDSNSDNPERILKRRAKTKKGKKSSKEVFKILTSGSVIELHVDPPRDSESPENFNGEHKCTIHCPFGCRGESRAHEIILFECARDRTLIPEGVVVSKENPVLVQLPNGFRKAGSQNRRGKGQQQQHHHQAHHNYYYSQRRAFNPDANSNMPYSTHMTYRKRKCSMPQGVEMVFEMPEAVDVEPARHKWNPEDASINIDILDNPSVLTRRPVAQSTDGVRALQGYTGGLHIFRIRWPLNQRGTHAVVGITTSEAPLTGTGYSSMIGSCDQSWGWDLGRYKAYHNSRSEPGRSYPANHRQGFSVAEKFYMVLDCDKKALGFISNGDWLGWAFENMKTDGPLYPSVSAVWGHCEIELGYHGGREEGNVSSLKELCRHVVRKAHKVFEDLEIPATLKTYLNYDR